jgi:glycosyltransferase involved in cell wall biosynthesis
MQNERQVLKILFLADLVFEDHAGGSRVVARELAGGLVQRGHEVTFLVRAKQGDASSETSLGGARIVRFAAPPGPFGYVKAAREACAKLLAEGHFDIAHTHFAYGAVGPLQVIPSSLPHIRSFYGPWHEEGLVEDRKALEDRRRQAASPRHAATTAAAFAAMHVKYALRARVERQNLRRSQVAVVLSEQSRREVLALGFPAGKIVKAPGGTDTDTFHPLPDNITGKADVRRALGLPEDRQILLSIRRLAPRMGLDKLIQAMPQIVAAHPGTCLIIGGTGPEEARLRQLIHTAGMDSHIRLAGFIPADQLVSYYQAADLFVLPTLALEGFGLVTTEALACGLAVIGTPIGATPEILSPLDSRLLARGTQPHDLAEAVTAYLSGPWRHTLTPHRLHDYILQNYTWDRHVTQIEEVYTRLLHESARPPRIP